MFRLMLFVMFLMLSGCGSTPLVLECSKPPPALLRSIPNLPPLEFYQTEEEKKSGKMKRTTEVKGHIDCAIKYRQMQAQCNALILWANQK